jgi:hypothetical protein
VDGRGVAGSLLVLLIVIVIVDRVLSIAVQDDDHDQEQGVATIRMLADN